MRWRLFATITAAVAMVALAGVFVLPAHGDALLETARNLRAQAGAPSAPIVALAIYIGGVVVGLPTSPLTAIAMLLFGVAEGGAIGFTGVLAGGSIVYAIGRFAARDLVERWLDRRHEAWFERLHATLTRRGFVTVVLLRLTPIPYALQNLALAVVDVGFPSFLCGTALGILPSVALVAALTSGLDIWLVATDLGPAQLVLAVAALALAAAAALAVLVLARRRSSRNEEQGDPQDQ